MGLDLAHQHLLGPVAVDHQVDKVGAAALHEDLLELQPVEHKGRRLCVMAVDHGRQLALAVQPPSAFA